MRIPLLLAALMLPVAIATPAAAQPLALDHAYAGLFGDSAEEKALKACDLIDAEIDQGNLSEAEDGLRKLSDFLRSEMSAPLPENVRERVFALRAKAVGQGASRVWSNYWQDHLGFPTAGDDADSLSKAVMGLQLYVIETDDLDKAQRLKERLAKSKEPHHAFLLKYVVEPKIAGVKAGQLRAAKTDSAETLEKLLEDGMWGAELQRRMASAKEATGRLKALGVSLSSLTLEFEGEELTYAQALAEGEKRLAAELKKDEQYAAKQKAAMAPYMKLLRADKAKLLESMGKPSIWDATVDTPKSLADARWWRYTTHTGSVTLHTTFYFDGQHKLTRKSAVPE